MQTFVLALRPIAHFHQVLLITTSLDQATEQYPPEAQTQKYSSSNTALVAAYLLVDCRPV